jgi:hypothetical protein
MPPLPELRPTLGAVGRRVVPGKNDLATWHPHLVLELVDPEIGKQVSPGSDERVRWRCASGHEWIASVGQRVRSKSGCPFCSGRRPIPGETDLSTTHPELAAELADPSAASMYSRQSSRSPLWRCARGHEWRATVGSRVKGAGCPFCAGQRAVVGETDLATTHPKLAAELVNQSLATTLMAGSSIRVSWRCQRGHVWRAVPSSRTGNGRGCPFCAGQRAVVGETDLATTHPKLAAELVQPSQASTLMAGTNRKVRWRCIVGHEWLTSPAMRTQRGGTGCPECASHGFSQVAPGVLYLVATPGRRVYKYGIANDPELRLANHERQGFTEVLEVHHFETGADARAAELRVMAHVRAQGWRPAMTAEKMPYGGASETLLADDVGDDFSLAPFLDR